MNRKPVLLVVMDGVGLTQKDNGNAVKHAHTPNLDKLFETSPHVAINAHGTAVGLPTDDDMGNSEVGHNALGCGQIYAQGAKLVNESIESGVIYETDTWKKAVETDQTLHFIGLLSDGNVHSHIDHLKDLIRQAKEDGVKTVRIHALMDGRDVSETSGLIYIDEIEEFMATLNDDNFDAKIASGGGRMQVTMDRYDANWPMVERGWKAHVLGEGRQFANATEAIETYREELQVIDQDLPEFVIAENNKPIGTIEDGDSVVFFNFRGDRALEMSRAFEGDDSFDKFDRVRVPDVFFAGMLQYDGDLHIPENYLVQPPHIQHTLTERLTEEGINEYAISETQKYGHVTYFWNGNKNMKISEELETWVEVPSDVVPFEQRPWMKAAEITDKLIEAMDSKKYEFLRVNYPNGDMVGHTGSYQATLIGVETVDLMLGRILKAADRNDVTVIITADHGNADEMYEKAVADGETPKAKTSHTLNEVPFIIYNGDNVEMKDSDNLGLANVAATVTDLLGVDAYPEWEESIIK